MLCQSVEAGLRGERHRAVEAFGLVMGMDDQKAHGLFPYARTGAMVTRLF